MSAKLSRAETDPVAGPALDAEVLARIAAVAAETTARGADVDAEEAARIAAVAAEVSARVGDVDVEEAARVAAIAVEASARVADVDIEEAARIAAVSGEVTARTADVDAEEAARIAAIAALPTPGYTEWLCWSGFPSGAMGAAGTQGGATIAACAVRPRKTGTLRKPHIFVTAGGPSTVEVGLYRYDGTLWNQIWTNGAAGSSLSSSSSWQALGAEPALTVTRGEWLAWLYREPSNLLSVLRLNVAPGNSNAAMLPTALRATGVPRCAQTWRSAGGASSALPGSFKDDGTDTFAAQAFNNNIGVLARID